MNRDDLIKELVNRTGEYKYTVEKIIQNYESLIEQKLLNGEDVHLHGFVTFQVKQHNEKSYVNPHTKEMKIVPPSKKIKVKVSSRLNKMIK